MKFASIDDQTCFVGYTANFESHVDDRASPRSHRHQFLVLAFGVRTASGSSQGSPLLQTGLQRCGDGLAEGESNPSINNSYPLNLGYNKV